MRVSDGAVMHPKSESAAKIVMRIKRYFMFLKVLLEVFPVTVTTITQNTLTHQTSI